MNKDCARKCLDWVQKRADVQLTDYAGLYMKYSVERRDLTVLLAERKLRPGDEGRLPLQHDANATYLPGTVFEEMRWN
jgi:hypothetical protein